MEKELTVSENIYFNDTSGKGFISEVHKELIQLNTKINNPIKKWAKCLNTHFFKEDIQKTHRHMKGCLTSLAIREMQLKITMRYQLVRMVIINKSTKKKYW